MMAEASRTMGTKVPLLVSLSALLLVIGCGRPRGSFTEAELAERLEDVAEYALDHVDASEEQTERVNGVLRGLAPDLVKLRDEHKALFAELGRELAKAELDRAAIEDLRARSVELFERASLRGTAALVASAEELTPEQRQKLVAKWEKHRRR